MTKLIYERSQPGRRAGMPPRYDLPGPEVPAELARQAPPRLPEVSELELVRHFTELASRNFGIDTGFYPLGSCTMKYNPRACNTLAMLPEFLARHPLVPLGVVFHRARAERIEMRIDRHVLRGKIDVVPDDVGLGQFGQRRRRGGEHFLRQ